VLPPRVLLIDIVALLLQLYGAVQITTVTAGSHDAASKLKRGKKIAQIGVAVQLICFGLFSIIAVRFNFTSKRFAAQFEERLGDTMGEKYCSIDGSEKKLKRNWQAILRVTNFASAMILVRFGELFRRNTTDTLALDPFRVSYGRLLPWKDR
jgi:hypothetical protein